ncbi:MAG: alanine racemase [Lachnospiraceae bacterium]|nr:alanine racemase [Lachnospiraceae bacterium]
MKDGTQRVAAYIDLSAVRFNLESMRANLAKGTLITAVIKTNAYGHGAVAIAENIEQLDYLWGFAVATFEEARELRDAGIKKPILILGYTFPYCYQDIARLDIRPAVFQRASLTELSRAAEFVGKDISVHIAIDTAMSRIGILADDEGLKYVNDALHTPGIRVEGIFTHFSKADEAERDTTISQIGRFKGFCERIRDELMYEIPVKHCSNSAGIISYKYANMDMVRAGITMYGLWPSNEVPQDIVPLKPVMSLCSHVVFVKDIEDGTEVSYGGTYVAKGTRRIATIPAGYGDGYPRSLSNKGYVLIRGKRAPIAGRVCMDQFMADVTDIPGVREGDKVTLVGKDGDEEITMEMLGEFSGRFNYELACDINSRVPRITVNR